MPYLEDTLDEAEANECAADCAADEPACCVPARGAAGSAATTAGKTSKFNAEGTSDWSGFSELYEFQ